MAEYFRRVAALTAALALTAGLAGAAESSDLDRLAGAFEQDSLTIVTKSGQHHRFHLFIADTSEQRARGLMFVRELPDDYGMLFTYPGTAQVSMWMKNTYIPLDMLFMDRNGTITKIARDTKPLSLDTISSRGAAAGVLELKGGITERLGIEPGDRVLHSHFNDAESQSSGPR